jgi:hypothetical protein
MAPPQSPITARLFPSIAICTGYCIIDSMISFLALGLYHDGTGSTQSAFQLNFTEIVRHLTLEGSI